MSTDEPIDVLIIGAGFAGLAAAKELAELGVSHRIVDSFEDHLGGRAYSYDPRMPRGTPLRFDHGAEYIGDLQNHIMALVREVSPADELVNGARLRMPYPHEVMVLGGERFCFRSDDTLFGIPGVPPQLGIRGALSMIALLAEMTLIEISIDVLRPWDGPEGLLELDQISVWDWLGQKKWVTPAVKDLVRISVEALLSVEPDEISVYYLLWYTACNDGFLNEINDAAGGPQQYWLRRGTTGLAERYAEAGKLSVKRGVRVAKIDLSGDSVEVVTAAGEVLRAKKVVVATSPSTAGRIDWTPAPPPGRSALMQAKMGRTIKCQVYYRSQWWHDSNGFQYDGYVGGADYPILWVMDNTPADATKDGPFVLMTFTVGRHADALGKVPSKEEVQKLVTETLRDLFQDERALATSSEFVKLETFGWVPGEKFVGGGPNTVLAPGQLTGAAGRAMDESWDDKVFFASAETARNLEPVSRRPTWSLDNPKNMPEYDERAVRKSEPGPPYHSHYSDMRCHLGYMDGALVSGRCVAHEVARSLGNGAAAPGAISDGSTPPSVAAPPPERARGKRDVLSLLLSLAWDWVGAANDHFEKDARVCQHDGGMLECWLRHTVARHLRDRKHIGGTEPAEELAAIRDFAASAVGNLQAVDDYTRGSLGWVEKTLRKRRR